MQVPRIIASVQSTAAHGVRTSSGRWRGQVWWASMSTQGNVVGLPAALGNVPLTRSRVVGPRSFSELAMGAIILLTRTIAFARSQAQDSRVCTN